MALSDIHVCQTGPLCSDSQIIDKMAELSDKAVMWTL